MGTYDYMTRIRRFVLIAWCVCFCGAFMGSVGFADQRLEDITYFKRIDLKLSLDGHISRTLDGLGINHAMLEVYLRAQMTDKFSDVPYDPSRVLEVSLGWQESMREKGLVTVVVEGTNDQHYLVLLKVMNAFTQDLMYVEYVYGSCAPAQFESQIKDGIQELVDAFAFTLEESKENVLDI